MALVEFEENNNEFHIRSRRLLGEPDTPGMVRILLKYGVVKNEKQALVVLVTLMLVAFSATFLLLRDDSSIKNAYVRGIDGRDYTAEEYVNLLENGIDVTVEEHY